VGPFQEIPPLFLTKYYSAN